jgi:hypothetical protein
MMNKSRLIFVVCVAAAVSAGAVGCRKKSRTMSPEVERLMRAQYEQRSPTPRPSPVGDMFDGQLARRAFDAIKERAGGGLKVRELRLSALGLDVLAEDPRDAARLVLYRWKNEGGELEGPQTPDLFGVMGHTSFDPALVDWSLLPAMIGEAKGKVDFQKPEVALALFYHPRLIMRESEPVWSIAVKTGEGEYKSEFFQFDAKGKLKREGAAK